MNSHYLKAFEKPWHSAMTAGRLSEEAKQTKCPTLAVLVTSMYAASLPNLHLAS